MKRLVINTVALIFGFFVGAFFTFAHAQVIWSSDSGAFVGRDSAGRIVSASAPSGTLTRGENSLLKSMDRTGITLEQSGKWDVLDRSGGKVSIPGKQAARLAAGPLARAAAKAVWLAKAATPLGVTSLLMMEGIRLIQDEWQEERKSKIPPDSYYLFGPVRTQNRDELPNLACPISTSNAAATGEWSGVTTFKCHWYWNGQPQTSVDMNAIIGQGCADGSPIVNGGCGESVTIAPSSENSIGAALENRASVMDDALLEYYNAVAQKERDDLMKDAEYSASGTAVTGAPKTSQTVNSDGTTKTTSTTTTTNIVNQGDTYNTSVVSVVSNSTTTTTQGGQTTVTTEGETLPNVEPQKTDCEKNPSSLGCSGFGSVDDSELQRKELTGTVSPVDMGGSGQCPAPVGTTVHGSRIELSFDSACTYARAVRPIILALAWLSAGFILIGAVRES